MTRHREREETQKPSENGARSRQTTIEDTDAYEFPKQSKKQASVDCASTAPPKTIDTDLPARRSHQEMDGMELDADERKTRVCVRRIRRFLWRREEECEVIFHGCGVPPTTRALFIPVQPSRWDHVAMVVTVVPPLWLAILIVRVDMCVVLFSGTFWPPLLDQALLSSDKKGVGRGVDWSTLGSLPCDRPTAAGVSHSQERCPVVAGKATREIDPPARGPTCVSSLAAQQTR
nr:unnamed protein product [Digitaria exilis]